MPKRRDENLEIIIRKAREMKKRLRSDKRVEQAGLWSRLLLNQVADYLPIGVALLNEQFVLRHCNKPYKEYINRYSPYRPEDALGMSYFDLFPDGQSPLVEALRSVRDNRSRRVDIEVTLQSDRNTQTQQDHWDASVVPIRDEHRRVTGIVILVLDVTEFDIAKKKLNEKETYINELETTLRTLLRLRQEDPQGRERNSLSGAKDAIIPLVGELRQRLTRTDQLLQLDAIEAGINDLMSNFSCRLDLDKYALTPAELKVAVLVKEGESSKGIAECLGVSSACIDFHRKNIRKKLGLTNTKINLRSYLVKD